MQGWRSRRCGDDDEAGGGDTTVTVDTSVTVDTEELEEDVEEAIETGEEALEETLTRDLEEQNDSGISGTVRLEPVSEEDVRVTIEVTGGEEGASHPAHIHPGTCEDLDPNPAYRLDNVEGGRSETTVDASPLELFTGEYAVNVHESEENADCYVACADIPSADD